MIEKKMLVADLFAFYGELLTDKQKDVLTLYCLEDLSLVEIADDLKISRQGVHDAVKRGIKLLEGYEEKLNLMEKFKSNNVLFNDIQTKMIELQSNIDDKLLSHESLKENVKEVISVVVNDIYKIIE